MASSAMLLLSFHSRCRSMCLFLFTWHALVVECRQTYVATHDLHEVRDDVFVCEMWVDQCHSAAHEGGARVVAGMTMVPLL